MAPRPGVRFAIDAEFVATSPPVTESRAVESGGGGVGVGLGMGLGGPGGGAGGGAVDLVQLKQARWGVCVRVCWGFSGCASSKRPVCCRRMVHLGRGMDLDSLSLPRPLYRYRIDLLPVVAPLPAQADAGPRGGGVRGAGAPGRQLRVGRLHPQRGARVRLPHAVRRNALRYMSNVACMAGSCNAG